MKRLLGILLLFAHLAFAQSVTTVEVYGNVPAIQVYSGLGTNITNANSWEYAAAQGSYLLQGNGAIQ